MAAAIKALLILLISVFAIHLVAAAPTEATGAISSAGPPEPINVTKSIEVAGTTEPSQTINATDLTESSGNYEPAQPIQSTDAPAELTTSLFPELFDDAVNETGKCDCKVLPDRYYGRWELDHTENMDQQTSWAHNTYANPNPASMSMTFERTNSTRMFNFSEKLYDNKRYNYTNLELGKKFGPRNDRTFYKKNNSLIRNGIQYHVQDDFLYITIMPTLPFADQEKYVLLRQK